MHPIIKQIQTSLTALIQAGPDNGPACYGSLVVAFSGGVDSTLLLHALCNIPQVDPATVHAVYVHHGLSANADNWQQHCARVCEALKCQFSAQQIEVANTSRTSVEASARDGRYAALLSYCRKFQAHLLVGQHSDDQLETFLLQAKRGAGPKGLAAMPARVKRDGIWIMRPMLGLARTDIVCAAHSLGLDWVEDESNTDNRFDRNFLRNNIIPALTQRWPSLATTVARSAQLCAQHSELLDEVTDERLSSLISEEGTLSLHELVGYSVKWQAQLVRRWLETHQQLMPGQAQLAQILQSINAAEDSQPCISLGKVDIRRYQHALYIVPRLAAPPQGEVTLPREQKYASSWCEAVFYCNTAVTIMGGMPSVRIRLAGGGVSKMLKDWLKQWRVPAWRRQHIPVVYLNQKPVAVIVNHQVHYLEHCPPDFTVTLVN